MEGMGVRHIFLQSDFEGLTPLGLCTSLHIDSAPSESPPGWNKVVLAQYGLSYDFQSWLTAKLLSTRFNWNKGFHIENLPYYLPFDHLLDVAPRSFVISRWLSDIRIYREQEWRKFLVTPSQTFLRIFDNLITELHCSYSYKPSRHNSGISVSLSVF